MKENKQYATGGIGFTGALTIAFIVLKLCGVISWSWVWVLSPIWITALIVGAIFFVILLLVIVKAIKKK